MVGLSGDEREKKFEEQNGGAEKKFRRAERRSRTEALAFSPTSSRGRFLAFTVWRRRGALRTAPCPLRRLSGSSAPPPPPLPPSPSLPPSPPSPSPPLPPAIAFATTTCHRTRGTPPPATGHHLHRRRRCLHHHIRCHGCQIRRRRRRHPSAPAPQSWRRGSPIHSNTPPAPLSPALDPPSRLQTLRLLCGSSRMTPAALGGLGRGRSAGREGGQRLLPTCCVHAAACAHACASQSRVPVLLTAIVALVAVAGSRVR